MSPTPTGLTLPPPPAELQPYLDEGREERIKRVWFHLGAGKPAVAIKKALVLEFSIPYEQADSDYKDAVDAARQQLDDENAIDGVFLGQLAKLRLTTDEFMGLAMEDIPERILDVAGTNPDDPEQGAIYRPITAAERATFIANKARCAEVFLKLNNAMLSITGRRSQRWHERPQAVIVTADSKVLSAEDKEFLRKLGMLGDT